MKLSIRPLLFFVFCSCALAVGLTSLSPVHAQGRSEAAAPESGDDEEDAEDGDADADVVEEGGSKVKVFRFTGLDISGRLKSPQLLYFLNRLRAEFDRPKLPHRSFMPELVRSTKAKSM